MPAIWRLWGPTRFLEPCDEPDLLAELERLSGDRRHECFATTPSI
jgi:hypothetical protein